MDVASLLDEGWASHKPVEKPLRQRLKSVQSTGGEISSASASPTRRLHHSSSETDALSPAQSVSESTVPSILKDESGEEQSGEPILEALSPPEVEKPLEPSEEHEEVSIPVRRLSYEDGLGPAPPLLTALILLLTPVWLPILSILVFPLLLMWIFVAGASILAAGFFSIVNSWYSSRRNRDSNLHYS